MTDELNVTDAGSSAQTFKVPGDRLAMPKDVFPKLRDMFGLPPRTKSLTIRISVGEIPTISIEYMPEIRDDEIVQGFTPPEETFR